MNKLLTIPKEKHIHRMKNGSLYKMALSQDEIVRLMQYHESDLTVSFVLLRNTWHCMTTE